MVNLHRFNSFSRYCIQLEKLADRSFSWCNSNLEGEDELNE